MGKKYVKKASKQGKIAVKSSIKSLISRSKSTIATMVFLLLSGFAQQFIESPQSCAEGGGVTISAIASYIKDRVILVGSRSVLITQHAYERMGQRSISLSNISDTIEVGKLFAYRHNNLLKIGYYYEVSKIFLALDQKHERIITVIRGVPREYVSRLISR